jgi:5-methylcytosine-specific restriction endonuclease McrA
MTCAPSQVCVLSIVQVSHLLRVNKRASVSNIGPLPYHILSASIHQKRTQDLEQGKPHLKMRRNYFNQYCLNTGHLDQVPSIEPAP